MLFGGELGVTTKLQSGGAYAVDILANGNVGIGTTSPDSKLEVKMNDTANNRLGFTGDGSTSGSALWTNWQTGNSYLDFRLGGTTDTYTKMRITSAGNVGINCTPSYKLQWSDGTRTGLLDTNIGAVVIGSVSNDALAFYTNLTEKMRITSSGNVGIGATSPTQKLDTPNIVIGGSSIAASYRANSTMMDNLGGVARFYSLGSNTSTGGSYQFNSLSSNLTAGAGTVMTIFNTGNVGIATAININKLDKCWWQHKRSRR